MVLDKRLKLFLVLASIFTTCLVVGDIIGGKLIDKLIPDPEAKARAQAELVKIRARK